MGYGTLALLKPLIGGGGRLSQEVQGAYYADHAKIGSALIYSRVMQEGAMKGTFGADRRGRLLPWGRIPARVWLGISKVDETAIIDIVDEHIAAKLESDRSQS